LINFVLTQHVGHVHLKGFAGLQRHRRQIVTIVGLFISRINRKNNINFRYELLKAIKGKIFADGVRNGADSDSDSESEEKMGY
jgi:hypothetical protein